MPRKGGRRKKTRTHVVENEAAQSALASAEALKVPRSLVIRRGKVESELSELVHDIRKLMSPYTALHFQEDAKNRKNTLSHYAKELTGPMGITHILALSQNDERINLRLARTPNGPTLTFKVKQFSLTRQVRSVQRRPFGGNTSVYSNPPVVVTNNFGDSTASPHVKLMRITFQNLFPAINVTTVKLGECRRVVLFNFMRRDNVQDDGKGIEAPTPPPPDNEEDEEVEIRHYAIRATPVGVNRKIRRLVQTKIPNLSQLEDISDYITGQTSSGAPAPSAISGNVSDSEPEDETSHVVLPQKYAGRGNAKSQRSALKLIELGPRLRLKLSKVERGLAGGDVMYHAYVKKTLDEIKKKKEEIGEREALKKRRREEQERNVEQKVREKEEKREKKRLRREERERVAMDELRGGDGVDDGVDDGSDDDGVNDGSDDGVDDGSEEESEE